MTVASVFKWLISKTRSLSFTAPHVRLFLASDQRLVEAQKNTPNEIMKPGSSLLPSKSWRHKALSKLRRVGAKRRLAAYMGVILLAAIAGWICLYRYAVSILDSALTFLKP
jgi:hypothetical protein